MQQIAQYLTPQMVGWVAACPALVVAYLILRFLKKAWDEMADPQTKGGSWWNDKGVFLYHFVRSNYVTAIWNWFMGLVGKSAEGVLTITVVYSMVKLLSGIPIPPPLDLGMFIAQSLALDIGGLSLSKLAQQARKDGNEEGAKKAEAVSAWLIRIMIAGLIVTAVGHVFTLPPTVLLAIETILLVARSIMAIQYAHVIHALKNDEEIGLPTVKQKQELDTRLADLEQKQLDTLTRLDTLTQQITTLSTSWQQALDTRFSEVDALSTGLSTGMQQALDGLTSRLSGVDQHMLALDGALAEIGPRLDRLDHGINAHRNRLDMVSNQVGSLGSLTQEVQSLKAQATRQEPAKKSTQQSKESTVSTAPHLHVVKQSLPVDTQTRLDTPPSKVDASEVSSGNTGELDIPTRQAQVLAFIGDYAQQSSGKEPSISEIITAIGCARQTAVDGRKLYRDRAAVNA